VRMCVCVCVCVNINIHVRSVAFIPDVLLYVCACVCEINLHALEADVRLKP
jgi:hypothetical protein